jgi:hypothetical protein
MTTKKKKTPRTKTVQTKKKLRYINQPSNTTASLIIDSHYAKLNIKERWNQERVERLCGFLRITLGELASLLGVSHGWWKTHIHSTKNLSGPICILLTIIETHFMSEYTKDVVTNLFDFNGKQKDT